MNGLTTLGGMPVALFLLVTSIQPAVIRGSLAALFFLTDIYAFVLSSLAGIVDIHYLYDCSIDYYFTNRRLYW